jgi:hypothetical protein
MTADERCKCHRQEWRVPGGLVIRESRLCPPYRAIRSDGVLVGYFASWEGAARELERQLPPEVH